MTFSPDQIWQYAAWFLALAIFGVSAYILALNFWQTANRHVAAILLAVAANTLAMGFLFSAKTAADAEPGFILRAMTTSISQIAMLIVSVVLVKPDWMRGSRRWGWWLLYGLALVPVALTVIDLQAKASGTPTSLWYTGPNEPFAGEDLPLSGFAHGSLSAPIRILGIVAPTAAIPLMLALAIWDKTLARGARQLAWLLGIAVGIIAGIQVLVPESVLGTNESTTLSNLFLAVVFAYAGFQQMISERRLQRGRLQTRLTTLVMVVALPALIAVAVLLSNEAGRELGTLTNNQLQLTSTGLKTNVQTWLDLNIQSLQELAVLPEIVSMDPKLQRPALQAKANIYAQYFLVHTTDLTGMNVARNDSGALQNYSDRKWFQGAAAGLPTIEILVSRTTGRPALNMAAPIRNSAGSVIGVASIVSELDDISRQIAVSKVGNTGVTYIVNDANRMVAHINPDVVMKDNQLVDATGFAPIAYLLTKGAGPVSFTDESGTRWRAYADRLDQGWGKGWGVVIQQQESELLNTQRTFQIVAWLTVLAGAVVVATLVPLAIRQAVQPIGTLTQTTAAIAAGDLTRTAPIESEDELGALARSFNTMTAQLRELIGGLEQRVTDRTADLKRRSDYLAASAEVARAASSILESDRLVKEVVELIRERFGLYYVGLFLADAENQWAVLKAGTGEAGQAMLARGHKLPLTGDSMIGWSIANAQARIALQAEADAVRRATTELPETRSEAALPLRSRGKVLGALTVQSAQPDAFDQDTVTVLQTMADQIAIALENARLLAESQAAVEAMRRASGELSREGWSQMERRQAMPGVRSAASGTAQVEGAWTAVAQRALQEGQVIHIPRTPLRGADGVALRANALAIPIKVRGNVIGVIDTFKPAESGTWTLQEIALAETLADQLGTALESARLYQDTQRRAAREQLTGQVTARVRESLDLDTVLQTVVRELGETLNLAEARVRLGTGPQRPSQERRQA